MLVYFLKIDWKRHLSSSFNQMSYNIKKDTIKFDRIPTINDEVIVGQRH